MESLDRMLGPATSDDGTTAGVPAALAPQTGKPAFDQLQRGDVMLIRSRRGFLFPWTWYYSHAGTYHGSSMVYEADRGGVDLEPLQEWKERGTSVALGRSTKSSQAQVVVALDQAKLRYGTNGKTKYNYDFTDKLTEKVLYCSQLTWKIHESLGVDMDSNDPRWFVLIGMKNFYAFTILTF